WATAMSSFVPREPYNKLGKTKAISGINIKVREGADREAILGQAITILSENHPEVKGRGGKGIKTANITEKNGPLAGL
ncbi:hypothetical protein ACQ1ZA_16130, partial [Enterococcus faecalis]